MIRSMLTWNLNHTGAARAAHIVSYLAAVGPDVVVLTEDAPAYTPGLPQVLRDARWPYVASADTGKGDGVLIASTTPVRTIETPLTVDLAFLDSGRCGVVAEAVRRRWLVVDLPDYSTGTGPLRLVATHIPEVDGAETPERVAIKKAFWDAAIAHLSSFPDAAVLAGDLNTGLPEDIDDVETERPLDPARAARCGTRFTYPEAIARLASVGWGDAWRDLNPDRFEYTYRSPRNGFRIDHIWLSPAARPLLRSAAHLADSWDAPSDGSSRRSDHRAVVATLDVRSRMQGEDHG